MAVGGRTLAVAGGPVRVGDVGSTTRAVTGIAHRNLGARLAADPRFDADMVRPGGVTSPVARPPSVRTVIEPASNPTTTVPSRSVRRTLAPEAARRAIVVAAG